MIKVHAICFVNLNRIFLMQVQELSPLRRDPHRLPLPQVHHNGACLGVLLWTVNIRVQFATTEGGLYAHWFSQVTNPSIANCVHHLFLAYATGIELLGHAYLGKVQQQKESQLSSPSWILETQLGLNSLNKVSLKWYREISRNDGHVNNERKRTIFICKWWTCPNGWIIEQTHMLGQKSSCMRCCWLIRMTKSTTCDSCFCFLFSFIFPPIFSHLISFDFLKNSSSNWPFWWPFEKLVSQYHWAVVLYFY
jgi:hypothetical protein